MSNALYELYDSDQPLAIPLGVKAAGYDDGYAAFPPYDWLGVGFQRFPDALHITVFGLTSSDVADVETGDLTPTTGCQWALARKQLGKVGIIYVNRANGHTVEAELRSLGIQPGEVLLWIATDDGTQVVTVWDDGSPVTYPVFAVQYLNQAAGSGGHYDRSLVYIAFGGGGGTITGGDPDMARLVAANITAGSGSQQYLVFDSERQGGPVRRAVTTQQESDALVAAGYPLQQFDASGLPDWVAPPAGGSEPTKITLDIASIPGTANGTLS